MIRSPSDSQWMYPCDDSQSMRGRQAAAHNPYLGPVNADWLALETIASMVPPYTMVERMGQQLKRQVIRELIQRHGLGASSLAGRLLHREAWSNTNQHCQLGRIALALSGLPRRS